MSKLLETCKRIGAYARQGDPVKDVLEDTDYRGDELLVELAAHYVAQAGVTTHETQDTMSAWAEATFGKSGSDYNVVRRAASEFEELKAELEYPDGEPKHPADVKLDAVLEEAADVIIVLMRLFARNGRSCQAEIDRKMAINRQRRWKRDGVGHGQHVA